MSRVYSTINTRIFKLPARIIDKEFHRFLESVFDDLCMGDRRFYPDLFQWVYNILSENIPDPDMIMWFRATGKIPLSFPPCVAIYKDILFRIDYYPNVPYPYLKASFRRVEPEEDDIVEAWRGLVALQGETEGAVSKLIELWDVLVRD